MAGVLDYVNLLQGTDSNHKFSCGSTLPLTGMPWGMAHWSPQTETADMRWFFHPDAVRFEGFRLTRQPSPWIGDYGQFRIMPLPPEGAVPAPGSWGRPYDRDHAQWRPDFAHVSLPEDDTSIDLTPTERGGIFRVHFGTRRHGRIALQSSGLGEVKIEGNMIRGFNRANCGGTAKNFASYFVVEVRAVATAAVVWTESMHRPGVLTASGHEVGGAVDFSLPTEGTVEVRVGISLLSLEQAERNLRSETADGFEAVRQRATQRWQDNLGRVEVEGDEEQKRTFYSCLYRTQLFPHRLYEFDLQGRPIHYSPYDGEGHPGILYGDVGSWDVYRTSFPLLTILFPEQVAEMLEGFLQAYREGGWLPEWSSPGYRHSMIGAHSASLIADAASKKIDPLDLQTAYQAMRKGAFASDETRPGGRSGLADYLRLGYVLPDTRYWMSVSLDYMYDDWCVAQVARELGHKDDYRELMRRAQNYRLLWDSTVGFMRGKDAEGRWIEPFDPLSWGGGNVEGSAWQCSWAVQHDPEGLANLLGGREALAAKLDQMLATPPVFRVGAYNEVIHEMAELASVNFGQYAQSNEPAFHHPFLYAAAGQPWKMEALTRRACAELYNSGPRGFPGDEDNGAMSGWYVLAALGFYPLCPGRPEYVLTSPVFGRAVLHLPGDKTFTITASNHSPSKIHVEERLLNGKPHTHLCLTHSDLMAGGDLTVRLTENPNIRDVAEMDLPYSASRDRDSG